MTISTNLLFNMLSIVKLILPAIFPSWNFFDIIVASPRIQYSLFNKDDPDDYHWTEFRPRPKTVNISTMVGRLFWNANWNETLFLISCAEKLAGQSAQHCENEIFKRLITDIAKPEKKLPYKFINFRLVFVKREGDSLINEVRYQSAARLLQYI